ncbi:MAG: tRNA lysidine(34) synthetase TilS [Bacteroidales bacterium]|nr:tRNA lysidine(34) synthetase TilS [Bacteroidales bacterium]
MLDRFQAYINRYHLIAEGDRLILALSGGIDSMVLTDLLLKAKVDFVVAHCNFHLRGEESDGDEKFVREYAENNDIQYFVKHFDTEQYAAEQSVSIEMAARDLRYAWFEELRQQLGYDKIAVAHHADDQAETFFMNLLRGAGLRGLKGMQPQNGIVIRPLLWASREQIRQYAVENQILWREDHTNAENVYLRNKIRNQLLPVFDELHPEACQGLYKSLEHLASENELYRELLQEKLNQIVERKVEIQSIPHSAFHIQHSAFQLLFEWLRQYNFNTDQCHFIFEAIESGIGNHYYSPTHQLVIGRNELQLSEIKPGEDEVIQIKLGEEEILSPIHLRFSQFEKTADFIINKSPNVAQLDAEKIQFPLTLRHWQHGDRFHPLGMKGSKLLSDFFVDQRFAEFQKRNVWLLVSADHKILWVVGYRMDDRFKIGNKTTTVFECKLG